MTYANLSTGELFDNVGDIVAHEGGEAGPKPLLSEDELLNQLIRLNKEINVRKEDIKQLIVDNKFHKKHNPQGIPVDEIKQIAKSAKVYADANYEEKKIEALTFFTDYERIVGYHD